MPARSRHAALVPSAERWSQALYRLRDRIFDGLGAEADSLFDEAALALDLLVEGELALEAPLALAVMADYALYDARRAGRNALERYGDLRRPARASKDGRLLAAMAASRCSVYRVRTVEAGVGLGLTDLLGGPARFVVDPEVAVLAEKGYAYVARLADLGEVVVTAGPALPLGEIEDDLMRDDLSAILSGRDPTRLVDLAPEETARLNARLWRVALDVTTAAIADLLEAAGPDESPGVFPAPAVAEAPPLLWLPGQPYDLPDLGHTGLTELRQGRPDRLRALPAAARPPEPLIVTTRPSLVPPPPTIRRAEPPRGEYRANVPTYLAARQATAALQNRIVETLTKEEFNEAGARLGILRRGVLVFDSQHELSILADFAVYDLRLDGRSPLEQFQEEHRAGLTEEERALLEAMVAHRYGIVMIEGREPGVGAAVTDLLGGPPFFLYDVNLSQTAQPGLVMATRLIAPAGLTMTTGAALPLMQGSAGDLDEIIELFAASPLAPLRNVPEEERADFSETIIRLALEQAGDLTFQTRDASDPTGPPDPTGLFGPARSLPRARGQRRTGGPRPTPGRPRKRRR